ncbi:MAG: transporter [Pseudomonadales bacterium]
MNFKPIACVAVVLAGLLSHATVNATSRADSHAPIGVMGDHTHKQGELMFSYRYMHMRMDDNLSGTSDLSDQEVIAIPNTFGMPPTLRVVPTEMTMDMHMFGLMYAPNDTITLMGMLNYVKKEMDHTTYMGMAGGTPLGTFTTRSSGVGDTTLAALIKLNSSARHRWHIHLGLSLPTGSIDEEDDILTPMNTRPTVRLPYPMQLGSGTHDLLAGLTYNGSHARWGWGAQWQSRFRLSENDEDYTLGDTVDLQGWLSYRLSDQVSVSTRLAYHKRRNIEGGDPQIALPVQTADPQRQAAERIDLLLGANFLLPGHRHRLALEAGRPVRQDLDGPQMSNDWQVTLGWQFTP